MAITSSLWILFWWQSNNPLKLSDSPFNLSQLTKEFNSGDFLREYQWCYFHLNNKYNIKHISLSFGTRNHHQASGIPWRRNSSEAQLLPKCHPFTSYACNSFYKVFPASSRGPSLFGYSAFLCRAIKMCPLCLVPCHAILGRYSDAEENICLVN